MKNEENCIYCDSFAIFKELTLAGHSMEDAFHTVLTNFEDGYVQAMLEVNSLVKTSIDKALCNCDECNGSCN